MHNVYNSNQVRVTYQVPTFEPSTTANALHTSMTNPRTYLQTIPTTSYPSMVINQNLMNDQNSRNSYHQSHTNQTERVYPQAYDPANNCQPGIIVSRNNPSSTPLSNRNLNSSNEDLDQKPRAE